MGHGNEGVAGLVEADVSVVTNAQQLQIDAAPLLDLLLVSAAHGFHILSEAVGHDGALLVDVDVLEEILVHEVAVALGMVAGKALVLIQVGGTNAGEIQLAGFAAAHQLAVERQGGGAGGKAEEASGLFLQKGGIHVSGALANFLSGSAADDLHMVHSKRTPYNLNLNQSS